MNSPEKRSGKERTGTTRKHKLSGDVPSQIPKDEAGLILACARVELQVSRREITEAFGTSPEVIRTFESGLLPLNRSLWKGYVLGVSLHHDIRPGPAEEVLRDLVHEIIEHDDHRAPV